MDSTCVLSYILNEDKRFHTFVANRVSTIHDASSPSQWNYVDMKSNPADDTSRGLEIEDLLKNKRWLDGPDFLWKTKDCWPKLEMDDVSKVKEDDPEVKKCKSLAVTTNPAAIYNMSEIFTRFSSWYRLKRYVAWLLCYRSALRKARERRSLGEPVPKHTEIQPMTVKEMQEAEREIVKVVQQQSFPIEIATIRKKESSNAENNGNSRAIKPSSPIYKLDPISKNDVLCVGGRLRNSTLSDEARNPVILPKSHHVVKLIIEYYHNISAHSGLEHVLALLRERYWIVGARVAINSVLGRCHDGKKRRASKRWQIFRKIVSRLENHLSLT